MSLSPLKKKKKFYLVSALSYAEHLLDSGLDFWKRVGMGVWSHYRTAVYSIPIGCVHSKVIVSNRGQH